MEKDDIKVLISFQCIQSEGTAILGYIWALHMGAEAQIENIFK